MKAVLGEVMSNACFSRSFIDARDLSEKSDCDDVDLLPGYGEPDLLDVDAFLEMMRADDISDNSNGSSCSGIFGNVHLQLSASPSSPDVVSDDCDAPTPRGLEDSFLSSFCNGGGVSGRKITVKDNVATAAADLMNGSVDQDFLHFFDNQCPPPPRPSSSLRPNRSPQTSLPSAMDVRLSSLSPGPLMKIYTDVPDYGPRSAPPGPPSSKPRKKLSDDSNGNPPCAQSKNKIPMEIPRGAKTKAVTTKHDGYPQGDAKERRTKAPPPRQQTPALLPPGPASPCALVFPASPGVVRPTLSTRASPCSTPALAVPFTAPTSMCPPFSFPVTLPRATSTCSSAASTDRANLAPSPNPTAAFTQPHAAFAPFADVIGCPSPTPSPRLPLGPVSAFAVAETEIQRRGSALSSSAPSGWLKSESLYSNRRAAVNDAARRAMEELRQRVRAKSRRLQAQASHHEGATDKDVPDEDASLFAMARSAQRQRTPAFWRPGPYPFAQPSNSKNVRRSRESSSEQARMRWLQHRKSELQYQEEIQQQQRLLLRQQQQELHSLLQQVNEEQLELTRQNQQLRREEGLKWPQRQSQKEDERLLSPKRQQEAHEDTRSRKVLKKTPTLSSRPERGNASPARSPHHVSTIYVGGVYEPATGEAPRADRPAVSPSPRPASGLAFSRPPTPPSPPQSPLLGQTSDDGVHDLDLFDAYRMAPAQSDDFEFFMETATVSDAHSDTEDSNLDGLLQQFKSPPYQEPPPSVSDVCNVSDNGEGFDLMCDQSSSHLTTEDTGRSVVASVTGTCDLSPTHSGVYPCHTSRSSTSAAATAGTHCDLYWPSVTDDESLTESIADDNQEACTPPNKKDKEKPSSESSVKSCRPSIPNYRSMTPWTSNESAAPGHSFPSPSQEIPCFPLDAETSKDQHSNVKGHNSAYSAMQMQASQLRSTAVTETVYSLTSTPPSLSLPGQAQGRPGPPKRLHSQLSEGPTMSREKRFRKTADALQKCGLWDIAIKTGDLIKRNAELQQEIELLRAESAVFLKAVVQNPENRELVESLKSSSRLTLSQKVYISNGFDSDTNMSLACKASSKVPDSNSSTTSGYASYTKSSSKQTSPSRRE